MYAVQDNVETQSAEELPACPTLNLQSLPLDFVPETNNTFLCLLLTSKITINPLKPISLQMSWIKPKNTFTPSWLQMLSARRREYAECLSAFDGSANKEYTRLLTISYNKRIIGKTKDACLCLPPRSHSLSGITTIDKGMSSFFLKELFIFAIVSFKIS